MLGKFRVSGGPDTGGISLSTLTFDGTVAGWRTGSGAGSQGKCAILSADSLSCHPYRQSVYAQHDCKTKVSKGSRHMTGYAVLGSDALVLAGGELCRGYKSDPNTETPPKLQDQPATQPRFQPPITANPGGRRTIVAASIKRCERMLDEQKGRIKEAT
jgi:hypothetical protein